MIAPGEPGLLQRTLGPGTYSITNGATSGTYSAFRYDGGDTDWAWNFVIGIDNGDGTASTFKVGWADAYAYSSQAGVAGATGIGTNSFQTLLSATSTATYYDIFTLAATMTLDFYIIDGYLDDNIGGVALTITQIDATPLPAALPLLGSGLGMLGLLGWRQKRRAATPTRRLAASPAGPCRDRNPPAGRISPACP